jgi:predicted ferric reductase
MLRPTFASATSPGSPLWYFGRAGGLVTLLLLAATVCLGIGLSLRLRSPSFPTFVTEQLHRYLTTVTYTFLAVHVVTIWLDPFTHFTPAEVLVPFVSGYRTVWLALGICAAELTVVLGLSVHLRNLIGYRAWRGLHYLTYATFPLAFLHGIATGSDTHTWYGLLVYLAGGLAVATMAILRVLGPDTTEAASPGEAGHAA